MPTHIPPVLAPHLQSCMRDGSTTLITSVLETPSNWLVLRFIKAALSGVDDNVNTSATGLDSEESTDHGSVVFLSFLRPYEFWIETGKKISLDLSIIAAKNRIAYIDALTVGLNATQSAKKIVKPRSHSLPDISHAISTAKSSISTNGSSSTRDTLIIDGLDFILASQPEITASYLNTFITDVRHNFSNVVLTASADSPLLHNIDASATPLELDHSTFVRSVAHQSSWILQLRPLETGHAKDVTGVIRISRGGTDAEDDQNLPDGEWLYQMKGDGSVRVWSRGE